MKQVSATVISNIPIVQYAISGNGASEPLSVTYNLIRFEAPYFAAEAQPGQFVTISCGRDFILRRPLSIHRVDSQNQLSILFAVVGAGTHWLSQRLKGEKLDLLGPLGNGFSIHPASKKLLLVAGGIGIAPLVFLAQKVLGDGKVVKLLLGARKKDGLYPEELLPKGIETLVTTEDGSHGIKGRITDILPEHVDWADQIYACGPLAMYQSIAKQREKWKGKPPVQVSLEVRIGCGIGACFGCSIKTKNGMKQVCRDGPVFNLDEVILEEVRI
ncbi:MAG: dihydroorotate dehydrogenase electron transfer subunit [Dehalococcoidia bacterium]|nr:dihydroorotate dehydrogenase electron transfer subunit [Dehalococcoidia bacterium]